MKALKSLSDREDVITISECLKADVRLSLSLSYLFSLLLMPQFLFYVVKELTTRSDNYFIKSLKFNLDGYMVSIGYYIVWVLKLKKLKPESVIMSNDHNAINRALILACNNLNIKTIFIQHAPAVKNFPKLNFDVALLEGQYSKDIYEQNERCSVHFVGSTISEIQLETTNSQRIVLGISTGLISKVNEIEDLIAKLSILYSIVLRPHPADPRYQIWKKMCDDSRIEFSDPKVDEPKVYFTSITALIGPMSGLLLEAAINKIPALCFNGSSDVPDWYGLIEKEVCQIVYAYEDIVKHLDKKTIYDNAESGYKAAQYYYYVDPKLNHNELVNKALDEL
jgi:hypothetical protein